MAGRILHAKQGDTHVLKFEGLIRYIDQDSFNLSHALDQFIDKLFQEDNLDQVVIDLCDVLSIDSTNLGLLAKIAQNMKNMPDRKPIIVSKNETVTRTLRTMGFQRVFLLIEEPQCDVQDLIELPRATDTDQNTARMVFRAHKALSDLNETNREAFRDVVETLARDIELRDGDQEASPGPSGE